MVNIILSGALGAMGHTVSDTAGDQIICGIDLKNRLTGDFPVYKNCNEIPKAIVDKANVILDFSKPGNFNSILSYALKVKLPLVVATTGLTEQNLQDAKDASKKIPIVISSNMSQGINAVKIILEKISPLLADNFDIEITEKHHNKKVDAPSGTALSLAETINNSLNEPRTLNLGRHGADSKREKDEIGISAIRGGTLPGEHSIYFLGEDEVIEIKHTSLSKKIFAQGALRACNWIIHQKNGLYDMNDVLVSDEV